MLQKAWYHLGRLLVSQYARWILKTDIQGKTSLPAGPKIIVANHPSTTDPAWITALTNEQATILIKELLFKVPLFGRSLRLAGHIPVVPGDGKTALEKAVQLLKAGRTVVVFPEGEISQQDGSMLRAHTGAARLALLTGAPVIPVGIGLDRKQLRPIPARVNGVLDIGYWYLHGPYAMTAGRPMRFEGDPEDRGLVGVVLDQIMQQISLLSHESSLRIRSAKPAHRISMGTLIDLSWRLFGSLVFRISSI